MDKLTRKKCTPCQAGTPPLKGAELKSLKQQLGDGWQIIDEHQLEKEYRLKNFQQALALTNAIGYVAEEEGHHPDLFLSWGKVKVKLWTHKIDGLSENDFILAAKCDECFQKL